MSVARACVLVLSLLAWPASVVAQTPAPPPPSPTAAAGQDGFTLQSTSGDFRLQIGLLAHIDGRFSIDDEAGQFTDTFALRRARAYLRARLARRFEIYFNPDFANGTLVVQDAYVETLVSTAFRLRAGKAKAPFGLERSHSASNLLFVNRALPTSLGPNRDVGFHVLGDLARGRVSYAAAVTNGVADGASADADANDAKDVTARLVLKPFTTQADSPLRGLSLGLAGSRGKQTTASALPTIRTALLEQPFFSYSSATADGDRIRYSPQASYYYKAFGGFAEYVHSSTPVRKGDARERIGHDAWQVAASWVLTGEAATDAAAGVRPQNNAEFANGRYGALQIAARYHSLEIDRRAFALNVVTVGSSQKAAAWTVGLNWVLTPNVRYTVDVERTVFDRNATGARQAETAFALRSQITF